MAACWKALTRRKMPDETESKLSRVLTLFDLTALGVGSTLGLGVYVLAGSVAYEQAGPAVTLSFLFAAIASAFAGLCYAEFAGRVPRAGSAYVYSYVTVGEFVAFTIGWNLILEYVIGTASVARGLSGYLDALINNTMSTTLKEALPINVSFLGEYPDFFSFAMVILLACLLAFGVKESSVLNNIFTCVNLATVCIVLVAGAIKADPGNWALTDVPEGAGVGGFMPYGWAGVMAGAAKCFYGFVGFDCVATTGEEAINPKKNIPLSIVFSLIIIFLSYFGVSTVLTMMWPYYLQNPDAPFPHVFQEVGWITIKWIVTIGAVFALCTSLLGAMFPLPRVLYAMGKDGIIFKFFSKVNSYTKTPLLATIFSGLFAALMALIFDLHQLIDMMSIGTLLAYTIVAICVLVLRYQQDDIVMKNVSVKLPGIVRQLFNLNFIKEPNSLSSNITKIGVVLFSIISIITCVVMKVVEISFDNPTGIIAICVLVAALLLILFSIQRQPVSGAELNFKVPLVPFIPCVSVFFNLYLMFQLDVDTWIRFLVWLAVGYLIYFFYGIRKSTQGIDNKQAQLDIAHQLPENGFNFNHNNYGVGVGKAHSDVVSDKPPNGKRYSVTNNQN
ncbi:high affinity cationic amino acid transporter 1-like [Eupeodes corollae]|uniref:high affinity cationic amino acid transporter 1-like n=1 Tax=Eupeodes corollae TaxID=290404 RepID=UPI00249280C1|nr:high affinity cationic amino acid transporter 1-like [Eupeodes corollae]XP_055904151.1 high affinity cationic amino acid transporter 1-like [Eupeodes corollae]